MVGSRATPVTTGIVLATRARCRSFGGAALGPAIPSAALLARYDEPCLALIGFVVGEPVQALGGTIAVRRSN